MTAADEPKEVRFKNFQPRADGPPPGFEQAGSGTFVSEAFKQFVEAAQNGKLPELPDIPQLDPRIVALAEELTVVHLPEWKNPGGRKLASPTQMKISSAIRVAQYLVDRGVDIDTGNATVRWVPTPGAHLGSGDPGKHIYRLPDGTWPDPPDPEEFWNIDDIETQQLDDGQWAAVHPRGIQTQAGTKTEAYAMCVQRVADRIAEVKGQQ